MSAAAKPAAAATDKKATDSDKKAEVGGLFSVLPTASAALGSAGPDCIVRCTGVVWCGGGDCQLDEIKEVFQIFDKDNSGSITTAELAVVLKGVNRSFTQQQLDAFIREVDADGNGEIDFNEFVQMMRMKPKDEQVMTRTQIRSDQI